ncbi:MAG: hypothetical protein JSS30_00540 [Verrucomicrobia bacterium]|nr:hypothetical protein [Verrucomicrobiota bacterium]
MRWVTCTALGLSAVASAAENSCPPQLPAACYPDDCPPCQRCLGPENFAGNPPVCPAGCNGDVDITIAVFCWDIYQDGMEFAIDDDVTNPAVPDLPNISIAPTPATIRQLNQLADARYKKPFPKWECGLKFGVSYCSPCDGWDVGIEWTWFQGKGFNHIGADPNSNHTLIALWSQFVPAQAGVVYATEAKNDWKVKLNLIDFELGRNFWVSRYLAIRPFVGLRYASIHQHNQIYYDGGSWTANFTTVTPIQPAFNGIVDLHNNYNGTGLRSGLDSEWNFGCGWSLYGNLAASIIYGRFNVDHDEYIRLARNPHSITNIHETEESFRALRPILDLGLGIKWSTMFCSCKYGFVAMLGYEQHIFFDQNQMWRVTRVGTTQPGPNNPTDYTNNPPILNLSGDNVFQQRQGTLDTSGWTLTFKFEY